jgi:hypothetical protein
LKRALTSARGAKGPAENKSIDLHPIFVSIQFREILEIALLFFWATADCILIDPDRAVDFCRAQGATTRNIGNILRRSNAARGEKT